MVFSVFSRQETDHKSLAKALKANPLASNVLAGLNGVSRIDHRTQPSGFLFKVVRDSEKILSEAAHDEKVQALLTQIHRSANLGVQSRFRAA